MVPFNIVQSKQNVQTNKNVSYEINNNNKQFCGVNLGSTYTDFFLTDCPRIVINYNMWYL